MLDQASRMLLVCGYPKSGRTTVVSRWAERRNVAGSRVLWVAAAPRFRDLKSLWLYLLDRTGDEGRDTMGEDRARDTVIGRLASVPQPVVLVLDDADSYLTRTHVRELRLLARLVEGLTVVCVGFQIPHAETELADATVVQVPDLQVSQTELADFAAAADLHPSTAELARVDEAFHGELRGHRPLP